MIEAKPGEGVPIRRAVVVGYVPRGPEGRALCIWCREREAWGRNLFCSETCSHAHRRSTRPPKARWQPCPGCGDPCIKCLRVRPLCRTWRWGTSRVPVWRANGQRVHGGQRPDDLFVVVPARRAQHARHEDAEPGDGIRRGARHRDDAPDDPRRTGLRAADDAGGTARHVEGADPRVVADPARVPVVHPGGLDGALTGPASGADALRALDDLGGTLTGLRALLNDLKGG